MPNRLADEDYPRTNRVTMLYERWLEVAGQGGNGVALLDLGSGQEWNFSELARAGDRAARPVGPLAHPQGHSAQFVLEVLRAWRWGVPACPLEPEQHPPDVPAPPAGIAHLKLTSATTGAARCIAFTADQLAADADHIVPTMGLRPNWPSLAAISLAHSYGFSNLVLPLLLHGIPLIVLPNPLPETLRRAAARCPAGTLPGVPALWRAWHAAGAIPPGVPLAISAGAPLAAALEQSVFADTGVKIHNFYGSSECGGIAYDRSDRPRQEDADAGTPLDQVAVWLGPDDCLCVESGAVGETYWPAPSDTLARGRFQTGDVAELRDGRVWLRGRLHDTINVAGRKAFPATIERALQQHPAVRDCLVFGVPTGEVSRGELVVACFSCRSSVTPAGLRDFLAGRLPAWQVPREWWQVESLETNARGKLSRAEWRDAFLRRSARSKGRAARS